MLNTASQQLLHGHTAGGSRIDESSTHNLATFKNDKQNVSLCYSKNGKIGITHITLNVEKANHVLK